jgi:hypothetical protein
MSLRVESSGKTFHVINPHPIAWYDLVAWLRERGYALREVPYAQWQAKLLAWARKSNNHVVATLAANYETKDSLHLMPILASRLKYDCRNTKDGLSATSIRCPPVDANLLETYFAYGTFGAIPTAAAACTSAKRSSKGGV